MLGECGGPGDQSHQVFGLLMVRRMGNKSILHEPEQSSISSSLWLANQNLDHDALGWLFPEPSRLYSNSVSRN